MYYLTRTGELPYEQFCHSYDDAKFTLVQLATVDVEDRASIQEFSEAGVRDAREMITNVATSTAPGEHGVRHFEIPYFGSWTIKRL